MKLVFCFLNQWSGLPKIILHSSLAKAVSNSVIPFNCFNHPYNWNGLNVWSRPNHITGLPWWLSGKESACQCRRHKFNPWVRKIPCWENSIETGILSRVRQITSPGWRHETSAQGWGTGKTQRDGMGRVVGGGIRMGNTCKSMADSCQCMAKTTTVL